MIHITGLKKQYKFEKVEGLKSWGGNSWILETIDNGVGSNMRGVFVVFSYVTYICIDADSSNVSWLFDDIVSFIVEYETF